MHVADPEKAAADLTLTHRKISGQARIGIELDFERERFDR